MGPFSASATAVADASGAATVYVPGPWRVGTAWRVGQAVLAATIAGSSTACTAELYRSAVAPSLLLGTSLNANADTMEGLPGDELQPGDQLVVIFAGCAPGTVCTVNMRGQEIDW